MRMSYELEHAFQTVKGEAVILILRDTLAQDIRYRELRAYGVPENAPDEDIRTLFARVAAYTVEVSGPGLRGFDPTEIGDTQMFDDAYRYFAAVTNQDILIAAYEAVGRLKSPNTDPVTKHDDMLTDEERADPN